MGLLRQTAGTLGAIVLAASAACTSEAQPEGDLGPEIATSAACLKAQGQWAWDLQPRLQRVTRLVLSSPEQTRDTAAVGLRSILARIERETQRRCGDGNTPLVPLVELAYSRDDETIDEPLLRQMVDEFKAWASAVGQPSAARILYVAKPCELVNDAVDAAYHVRRRPEPGGTAAWVEFRVTSDWTERLMLTHRGEIQVDGLAPQGNTKRFVWGGSSYDTAMARRGGTTRIAAWPVGLRDQFVHLLPGGTVRPSKLYMGAYSRLVGCNLTLRPAN